MSAPRRPFERGIGGPIAGAACFLLAAALLAGACRAAVSEIEKVHDGKVVSLDIRGKTIDIEYPGVKAPVTVSLDTVSLEDPTGRPARPEVFKPGTAIRVRVREITTTPPPPDPTKGPPRANPPQPTVETVVKEIRVAAPPAANTGAAAATKPATTPAATATPAVKPAPTPAPAEVAPVKPPSPAVPVGPGEVIAGPPPELTTVNLPAGASLIISLVEPPLVQPEIITLRLKCFKASVNEPDVIPDAAAVFYVTDSADLTASSRDLAGPVGTVGFWRGLLESTKTFLPFAGQNRDKDHAVSAAIAKFNVSEPFKDRRITVAGSLKAPLDRLSPRVIAVVLMSGSKAASNTLWIRFGAPAAKPPAAALAPAATVAPARAVPLPATR
jgi:hypothetical protein